MVEKELTLSDLEADDIVSVMLKDDTRRPKASPSGRAASAGEEKDRPGSSRLRRKLSRIQELHSVNRPRANAWGRFVL
ncbi:hypothetical protein KP806_11030 [Paenibacillus sp. N4]|uniref:hypothetical protein n=1 Tax=Paenibacillus vietnamensis TaxID=2590547 RepID=UPI001CD094B5|nr:hypothetical protein [Paenibacillus vietnamensis]MCA0755587.1 hypothetical protein [Paenibacillus vietnamensis]